ncbi:hypothetical protein RFI_32915 [Reticulomyxa filosa]|uniref:Uncharacterized protein n=1 Tax=Reticulomyxa filosa TaxID=46433 RepID=X6LUT1_RETFI|nr:hypothetical protein RFI_32915 [Reticulomyxa filosa]|eukprot:ETO04480.1 hypothetical protein RFI_32915 [Reticulomyxa filosa]
MVILLALFCFHHLFILVAKKKKKKKEIAFQKTIFNIKRWQRYSYWTLVAVCSILYTVLVSLMSATPNMCATQLTVRDFNPFHGRSLYTCAGYVVHYKCFLSFLKEECKIYLGLGVLCLSLVNTYLSYGYIIRLLRLILLFLFVIHSEQHKVYKIERSCVIAITSVFSTVFCLGFAAALTDVGYLAIPWDICLNGIRCIFECSFFFLLDRTNIDFCICMLCAFKFGDIVFNTLFGCCMKALNKRAGIINTTLASRSGKVATKTDITNTSTNKSKNYNKSPHLFVTSADKHVDHINLSEIREADQNGDQIAIPKVITNHVDDSSVQT